ncbi:MAG: hypothetical protein ACOCU4_05220 [Alkalispirochaeta sp.]
MSRTIRLIILLVFLVGALSGAGAQAQLSIASLPGTVSVANQIFSESTTAIPITVAHEGDAASWFVTVSRGNSSSFDPRQLQRRFLFFFTLSLNYNIFTPSDSIARDTTGPLSASNVLSGSFAASTSVQTDSREFTVRIPSEQFVRQGTYTDEVDISLYRGSVNNVDAAVRVERRTVDISSVTSSVAEVGLVESGGAASNVDRNFTMDFGPLSSGETKTADLLFRANSGYFLEAESANQGELLNVNRPGNFTIPYEFRYDGDTYDLSSPRTLDVSFLSGTGISFARRPISVQIGAFSNVPSGLYEDVITFTISTF